MKMTMRDQINQGISRIHKDLEDEINQALEQVEDLPGQIEKMIEEIKNPDKEIQRTIKEAKEIIDEFDEITKGSIFECSFCGKEKKRMTIQKHPSGKTLFLCFHGCQHFPEPYRDAGFTSGWERIDPWIQKRSQPRLRHKRGT